MRAISPSSRMISQMTPAGVRPARRARSTEASVWPARTEDAAAARAQREDVAGTGEVGGGGAGIDGGADGAGAVGGRNAGGDALAGFDGLSKRGAEARGVLLRHGKEAQVVGALLSEGEADEAAAVAGHEVDGLGGDVLGGQGEVALVLAVLVVDHDDHAAGLDFVKGAGDVGKGGLGGAGGLGHDAAFIFADSGRECQKGARRWRG